MGLFDSIFGSKKTSSSTTTSKQTTAGTRTGEVTEQQIQESQRAGVSTTEQDTASQQTIQQLDPETQSILQNLIKTLSGTIEGGGGSILPPELTGAVSGNLDFANLLAQRAGETEGVIRSDTEGIITEARRQGENALELQGTALARGAGSNLNSIVQSINAQGRSDLETQLGGLRGTLGIQAREAGSQDLATALGALVESARSGADISIAGQTAGTQQIAQLAEILSGATKVTTGATQAVGKTTEEEQITQLLEAIRSSTEETKVVTDFTGTTNVTETGRDSLFSNILSIGSLFTSSGD